MPAPPPETFSPKRQVEAMLRLGWHRAEGDSDMLVHPEDEALRVHYDRPADTLRMSPALDAALARVILTRAGERTHYWPLTAEEKTAMRVSEAQSSRF